jgi:hypothetical protein
MSDEHFDDRSARWIICETSGRWITAVKRFAPQLNPPGSVASFQSASATDIMARLAVPGPRVILWEFHRAGLVKACESVTQVARLAPETLQLVACQGIGESQQIALTELPVAAFFRHPEDLPRLRPMIQGYFARHRQLLD